MVTLHFDVSKESLQRLDRLFSTYGWSHTIYDGTDSVIFLLMLLEEDLVTVTEVPYDFDDDIAANDSACRGTYYKASRGKTQWRSGTAIEKVRMNAVHLLKKYGTPTVEEGKYFLYEDSHVSAYAGDEAVFDLITHVSRHPDLEKWILFPNPTMEGAAYYVFDLTPSAVCAMARHYDQVMEKRRRELETVTESLISDLDFGDIDDDDLED